MLKFINLIMLIICVLINIAFISLFQRKIFGVMQIRKGPNKLSILGLTQPFSDAIKLFTKELIVPKKSKLSVFTLAPTIMFTISLILWLVIPVLNSISINYSIILIYLLLSLGIFPSFFSAWYSFNSYATLGAMRAIAQTISYEIVLGFIIFFYLLYFNLVNLFSIISISSNIFKLMVFLPMFGLWMVSLLMETNNTPFDFVEGESELVSGFNVEYGGVLFSLIFMMEYNSILFMAMLTSLFFFSSEGVNYMNFLVSSILVFFWMWMRCTLPRFRYDKLMIYSWGSILPSILFMMFFPFTLTI